MSHEPEMLRSPSAFDPAARIDIGHSGVSVSRLGLGAGTQSNGGGPERFNAMLNHAWQAGLRYVDTAPLYLAGESERRVGSFAQRHDVVISTKVGRLADDSAAKPFTGARRFDYSASAVRASLDLSMRRLGRDTLDIVVIHDVDQAMHGQDFEGIYQQVVRECWPVLEKLRGEGIIKAVGLSSRQSEVCQRAITDMDLDCLMMAGSYTLLNHEPELALFPQCESAGVSVLIASPFNTGILATGSAQSTYDYAKPSPAVLQRVSAMASVGERHGVPLAAAALQFPLRHPAVAAVVCGHQTPAEVDSNIAGIRLPIPDEYWHEMADSGLIPAVQL